jgi:hypothetical protein
MRTPLLPLHHFIRLGRDGRYIFLGVHAIEEDLHLVGVPVAEVLQQHGAVGLPRHRQPGVEELAAEAAAIPFLWWVG